MPFQMAQTWKKKKNKSTCTHKITNLPTQVNISDNLYFLWNCNNMYTLLILDKDKYLICSLRVIEMVKCSKLVWLMFEVPHERSLMGK